MRFLDHDDADDPILSVVNLIDLFLVVTGILMIVIVTNPLNPFSPDKVTVVENPGGPDMRITVSDSTVSLPHLAAARRPVLLYRSTVCVKSRKTTHFDIEEKLWVVIQ